MQPALGCGEWLNITLHEVNKIQPVLGWNSKGMAKENAAQGRLPCVQLGWGG